MRFTILAVTLLPFSTAAAQQPADVALFPVVSTPAGDTALARAADSSLVVFQRKLVSLGLTVVRQTGRPPKSWTAFRAARLAVVGKVTRVRDTLDVQFDLLDAANGEELRVYFYQGTDLQSLIRLGEGAGPRIHAVALERRPPPRRKP